LGIGFTISAFYSLIVFSTRDEEAELNVGEIILAIFLYPFIIYQIFKNYKNGK
jgi:Na+/H+ antiporter NhaA